MLFSEALIDTFIASKKTAISKQELYDFFLEMWENKEYKGIKISDLRYNSKYYKKKFKNVLRELESYPQIKCIGDDSLGSSYLINLTISPLNISKLICDLYPLGYISYLSAMQFHKLINTKNHNSVLYTTVDRKIWKNIFYDVVSKNDYPFFSDTYHHDLMDLIPRFPTEEKYLDHDLVVFTTKNLQGYETLNDIRVRQLPFLFLDMVRTPQYCGGVETVLSVFKKYSKLLLEDILDITQSEGTNIDKARIGFILDEILNIKHPTIDEWKTTMVDRRGGSRKFIAYLPFESRFSATWNISLNHTSVKMYGQGIDNK